MEKIAGYTLYEQKRNNNDIRQEFNIQDISGRWRRRHARNNHINRITPKRLAKIASNCNPNT